MANLSRGKVDRCSNVDGGDATTTTISSVHPDIIQTHILSRLDGPTLASVACTSSQLYSLATQEQLWDNRCHATWPSTTTPLLRHVISTFPRGSLSFFSDSFPLVLSSSLDPNPDPNPISEFISAVDVYHRGNLLISKVVETETESAWFKCSPFRVDLIDPKDVVPTPIVYPNGNGEEACKEVGEEFRLSWILIDPSGQRALNLSSQKAVFVQRHWLSGEVQLRFATILAGNKGSSSELVQCGVVVTCSGSEGEQMQIKELALQMEDMDGTHLNGRDSLAILQKTLRSKKTWRKSSAREEEGRKRYQEYLEMKRVRRERKVKKEGTLDMLCMGLATFSFAAFWLFIFLR